MSFPNFVRNCGKHEHQQQPWKQGFFCNHPNYSVDWLQQWYRGISTILTNQYCAIDPAYLTQIYLSCADKHRFISWWIPFLKVCSTYPNTRVNWFIHFNDWLVSRPYPQRRLCISCSEKHLVWPSLTYIVSQWSLYSHVLLGKYIFFCHFTISIGASGKVHSSVEARRHWTDLHLQCSARILLIHTHTLTLELPGFSHKAEDKCWN